ncbi:GNAT family N-acetyltransferase [Paenibacillus apiarius]|uniref:GNAT family N-acetyltransferase n=1 Tax=Paenibacillus apiarius TaxID=46240 RepID=UPI00197D45C1|nr:GNAT family N-acetyltransferase [Paenibacillus apiarius]MBN3526839.1 GNAT family N-acetyltransferase [Paenibacillus apiarius]
MITIRPSGKVAELAEFIADLNQEETHHVGYCGTEKEEIESALQETFEHIGEAFWEACQDGEMIGTLGFDIDTEERTAEMWGPFIRSDAWLDVAAELWRQSATVVKEQTDAISGFYDVNHLHAAEFISRIGGQKRGEHLILLAKPSLLDDQFAAAVTIQEIQADMHEPFIRLHQNCFPSAYFDGRTILNRRNSDHRLFVCATAEGQLQGYVYVEANPEFQEGNIEFIAVSPEYRHQGTGAALLRYALQFLFKDKGLQEIALCVDMHNEKAIHLYKKAGFAPIRVLSHYRIELHSSKEGDTDG